jgi:hypothetical protein
VYSVFEDLHPVPARSASVTWEDAVLSAGPAPDDASWLVRFDPGAAPVKIAWIDMVSAEARRSEVFGGALVRASDWHVWRIRSPAPPRQIVAALGREGHKPDVRVLIFPTS